MDNFPLLMALSPSIVQELINPKSSISFLKLMSKPIGQCELKEIERIRTFLINNLRQCRAEAEKESEE